MTLCFSKYAGCGNDFILVDNRTLFFPTENRQIIRRLCERSFGVGADGLILIEQSTSADFKMRIFNCDGSEAEMCGNGIRCLFKFILELGYPSQAYTIEVMGKQLHLAPDQENVSVEMAQPSNMAWHIDLAVDGKILQVHHLDTGVPHAVYFLADIEKIDVNGIGAKIRYHPTFLPKGANANFAKCKTNGTLQVRTYERGVEHETLACGTGATATALAAAKIYGWESPIVVETRSGENLKIGFQFDNQGMPTQVTMSGPASFVFRGEIPSFPCV
jgi:diaminopimelate epimerase